MSDSQVLFIKIFIYLLFMIVGVEVHIRIRVWLFKKLGEEYELPLLYLVIVLYCIILFFVFGFLFH